MPDVLLATCAAYPDGDEEGAALLDALHRADVDASFAVWDDRSVDWSSSLVVLRSTWDYTLRREDYLAWAGSVPRLHNPVDLVRWNSDKVYLRDLDAAGIPITPTTVVGPGERVGLPDVEFVVKPAVGAGSRGAGRFLPDDAAAAHAHLAALHGAGRTALVQPYLAGVDARGETALVYLDGAFSHAIGKGAMLSGGAAYDLDETLGLFIEENITAREASAAELAVGERAVALVRDRFRSVPLYARVDLLPGPGGPVVIELELVEPSLFLGFGRGAADRFAAAIVGRG